MLPWAMRQSKYTPIKISSKWRTLVGCYSSMAFFRSMSRISFAVCAETGVLYVIALSYDSIYSKGVRSSISGKDQSVY